MRKILHYIRKKDKKLYNLLARRHKVKKVYIIIFDVAIFSFLIFHLIHVFNLIFELDKGFEIYKIRYVYFKDFLYIFSIWVFFRIFFDWVKIELAKIGK